MTQRSLEDDLFGAEYLAHEGDFAKGIKFGENRQRLKILKLVRKLRHSPNSMHVLYQIIDEHKEDLHLHLQKKDLNKINLIKPQIKKKQWFMPKKKGE